MSKIDRAGATVLLGALLVALVTNLVMPTLSDDGADRLAALTDHHTPMVVGMTLEVFSIALMIGGIVWLATAFRHRAPRLALAGGVLGFVGGLVVLFEDGLAAAAPAIAGTLGAEQAGSVLDHVHSSVAGRAEPVSLLFDLGLICLGAAAVKAGAPAWLGAAVALGAIAEAAGLATGTRVLAVAGFAVLFLSLAGVVRVLAASPSRPVAAPATAPGARIGL